MSTSILLVKKLTRRVTGGESSRLCINDLIRIPFEASSIPSNTPFYGGR